MFTTTATGSYNFRFYLMDKASGVYYLRTNTYIQVADDAYPSVASIVGAAVSQAKQNTNGSEYEIALYLHDWLLDQLEYDNSLKWSSAESALTRGLGTCQAYESAYAKIRKRTRWGWSTRAHPCGKDSCRCRLLRLRERLLAVRVLGRSIRW